MKILTLRTDKPEAEISIFVDMDELEVYSWHAHRQLSETIHIKIKDLLDRNKISWHDIGAIVVFKGPGSFTGLRIGVSVANAIADGLGVPIVGTTGRHWKDAGIAKIHAGLSNGLVIPEYGAEPHITKQKK